MKVRTRDEEFVVDVVRMGGFLVTKTRHLSAVWSSDKHSGEGTGYHGTKLSLGVGVPLLLEGGGRTLETAPIVSIED